MAEFVEFRIEETIPEMEEMERLGILSNKEVKKLIQKRRDFQYRLARRSKKKIDFINYINYEKKLIELIRIRRTQIGVYEKRRVIESSISRRVLKQARLLTRLWPSHLDGWALRINFSRFIGWKEEISGSYTEQVKFHGNCESVWIAWAKWEVEERRNFDKAREILLSKAPLYHPRSCIVKRELFRLELLYVEMLVNKVKHENIAGLEEIIAENRNKVLNCAVARAVYLDAVRSLPVPELYLELYQVVDKFKFAHKLREEIYRDFCMKFPGAECLWKLKAQRLVSGLGEAVTEPLDTTTTTSNANGETGDTEVNTEVTVGKHSECKNQVEKDYQGKVIQSKKKGKCTKIVRDKIENEEETDDKKVSSDNDGINKYVDAKEEDEDESAKEDSGVEDDDEVEQEGSNGEEDDDNEMGEDSDVEDGKVEEDPEEEKVEEKEKQDETEEENEDEEMEEGGSDEEGEAQEEVEREDDDSEDMEEEDQRGSSAVEKNEPQTEVCSGTSKDDNRSQINSSTSPGTNKQVVESEGASKEDETGSPIYRETMPVPSGKLGPKAKLQLLISVFDEAMKKVGNKFVNVYIGELLPLLHQCWGVPDMTSLIYKSLLRLFEHQTALLSPLHFYIWYHVLCQQAEGGSKQGQAVLERGVRQHPTASYLQLELARCIIKEADTDAQLMKEFRKVASSMQGECGLTAWKEFAKHLCKDSNKTKVFKASMDHEDPTVARGMRVLYLQDVGLQEGIAGARKLYQTLKWWPPFCGRLQAQMVKLELAQDKVNAEAVREVFNVSLQQHGSTNPGVWLAYIQFEKQHGDPLKAGGIATRAEKELQAQQACFFRELTLTIREIHRKEETPAGSEHNSSNNNRFFIENTEEEENQFREDTELQPGLVTLFEEELLLSYTANNDRSSFFSAIHSMEKNLKKGNKPMPAEDGREWEQVLELLLNHKITLSIQEVKVEVIDTEKRDKPHQEKLVRPRFKEEYEPTDYLNPGKEMNVKTRNEDDIEKILSTSEVLKPDFMQKTSLSPYFVSKKKAKEIRKKESMKTKGPGWFNMKAPELTEEAKRDLEVLQMRSVLDPKRHYKNDMKVLPKYFQLAEVVDSPLDFYSSRVPKKQRKRTMAEEIMHDEETLRYQKRKYNEIIAAKQKKQFKHPNVLRKKKTKKLPTKK